MSAIKVTTAKRGRRLLHVALGEGNLGFGLQAEIANVGLGTMRSAGTYIGLLLQAEDPGDRASVLVDVMQTLGIPLEEVADRYNARLCKRCGCADSPLHPCECKRRTRVGGGAP